MLRTRRNALGWTQQKAAAELGVSQSYLAMLEGGQRRLTRQLARRCVEVMGASPVMLPARPPEELGAVPQDLAEALGALGYPGFAYFQMRRRKRNPAEVLLQALAISELEARLVEALPWLLARYWEMDDSWLVSQAKAGDLQNRLGFVCSLARELALQCEPSNTQQVAALKELEEALEPARLAREDTFGRKPESPAEWDWVRTNRSETAKHWNLLTLWRTEDLHFEA